MLVSHWDYSSFVALEMFLLRGKKKKHFQYLLMQQRKTVAFCTQFQLAVKISLA